MGRKPEEGTSPEIYQQQAEALSTPELFKVIHGLGVCIEECMADYQKFQQRHKIISAVLIARLARNEATNPNMGQSPTDLADIPQDIQDKMKPIHRLIVKCRKSGIQWPAIARYANAAGMTKRNGHGYTARDIHSLKNTLKSWGVSV
jgi:hypothetical protein